MQGREFGLYIYTSMRVHVNDMRICVFLSMSLRHLFAYTQKNEITIIFIDIQT